MNNVFKIEDQTLRLSILAQRVARVSNQIGGALVRLNQVLQPDSSED